MTPLEGLTPLQEQLQDLAQTVRGRHPALTVARVYSPLDHEHRLPGDPEDFVRVATGRHGPYRIVWDDVSDAFIWHNGPDAGETVGTRDDLEKAADTIAAAMSPPSQSR